MAGWDPSLLRDIEHEVKRGYCTAALRYEFYFRVVKTIFYEQAQRVSKILFLTRENKIHIFKSPCNFLFLYIDKSIARHFSLTVRTNDRERAGNDVINILTSEDMENTPLGSRM